MDSLEKIQGTGVCKYGNQVSEDFADGIGQWGLFPDGWQTQYFSVGSFPADQIHGVVRDIIDPINGS